jgi:hypothetical protein
MIVYRASTVRIRFTHDVRAQAEQFFELAGGDERECGLKLYGHVRDDLVEVLRIDGPAVGTYERVDLDFSNEDGEVTEHGDLLCGDAHSQPGGWLLASPRDCGNWATIRRELGLATYVGLVTTRTRTGWQWAGWIVRYHDSHQDRAERSMPL